MYIRRHEHDYALTAPLALDPITATVIGAVGAAASAGATLLGSQMAAKGAKEAARAEAQAAEYRAKLLDQKANESRAIAQRQAFETQRKGELAQSQLRARAAASGAGAADESVLALGEQIAGQGEYERLMQMYSGENQYTGYKDAAAAERYNGSSALVAGSNRAKAIQIGAIGTLASDVSSFADKASGFAKLPSSKSVFGSNYADLRDGGFHLQDYSTKWG